MPKIENRRDRNVCGGRAGAIIPIRAPVRLLRTSEPAAIIFS
jgi:hypothetical protein